MDRDLQIGDRKQRQAERDKDIEIPEDVTYGQTDNRHTESP